MKAERYRFSAAAAALLLMAVWAIKGFAQLTDKQMSLAQIKTLYTFVQGLNEQTQKAGLNQRQIQAQIEGKLASLNIKVVSEQQGIKEPGSPVLYVNISAVKRQSGNAFVFHIDLGILQKVTLVRQPQMGTMAITWNKGRLGFCDASELAGSVKDSIEYLMNKFVEDYKLANADL